MVGQLECGCRVTSESKYCPLHRAAPALLASVKELREAAAACFRAIVTIQGLYGTVVAPTKAHSRLGMSGKEIIGILDTEFENTGIRHGFGVRAEMVVAQAENNIPEYERLKKIEEKRIRDDIKKRGSILQ